MITVECVKCKEKILESDLFVTDEGKVTKVCIRCAEAIMNERFRIKEMKSPKFIICDRCGRRKFWPTDFAPDSDVCVRCSTYGSKRKLNSESHVRSVMKWRKDHPERYAEHKKRNNERKAAKRAEYSEADMERNRMIQKRYREKQKYLKVMEKIKKERMKRISEMEERDE